MLGNMKPIPRFILIVAIIGGAAYGISKLPFFNKVQPPVTEVQTPATPVTTQAPATEAPAPAAPVAQEPSQSPSNAGIDAVMKAGKK